MKVLIVGNGGREHALAWKLAQSPKVARVFCAPGNAGTALLGDNVEICVEDIDKLLAFAREEGIGLTVVGPEIPLTLGIVDAFRAAGLKVFGPTAKAAELEGSKAFAKDLMAKYDIPTAKYAVFTAAEPAKDYVGRIGAPCVVKADGLAAGKGVIVAMDLHTALNAVDEIFDGTFGEAGRKVVVEEFLEGQEVSLLAFVDGKTALPMVPVQDHKRIFDGDQGPNTGGMGTYSPPPMFTEELAQEVMEQIVKPTVAAMLKEGREFTGVLFTGLILTKEGPKVLEYNARFGDPETQVIMMRLESDLVEIIEATLEQSLDQVELKWSEGAAVCVVLAAGGYPGAYNKGHVVTLAKELPDWGMVLHAGTSLMGGLVLTNGGRVLGVVAKGSDLTKARERAYQLAEQVSFEDMFYRKDIGAKGLAQ
ncbi:MAG TPA: phosphoribosylamine--glycine ligase [Candidatus Deferrimicrobium sp.]|nr:phosphoribosylamine--glycine ligase [Candidatus Deferrimicrobium sp.]